jgi:hypothetical protein
MDPRDSVDEFIIQTNDLHMLFRRVDLSQISQAAKDEKTQRGSDRRILMENFGDFDALQSMFGTLIAVPFKLLHLVAPETVFDIYIDAYDNKLKKMPH